MARRVAVFFLTSATLAGCAAILGREDIVVDADPRDANGLIDGGPSEGSVSDTAPSPTRCAWNTPFEAPRRVDGLAGGAGTNERSLAFTFDETTVLFSRHEAADAGARIFKASRLPDGGFTAPSVVPIAGFNPHPTSPVSIGLAPSGDRLYVSFFPIGGSPLPAPEWDLFIAAGSVSAGFGAPQRMSDAVNSSTSEQNPAEVGGELFFDSDYPPEDGGPRRNSLYSAPLDGGPRSRLKSIGGGGLDAPEANDMSPVLSRDRLTLFYASRRAVGIDIFVTHRVSTTGRFDVPVIAAELSSPDLELPLYLSADECQLYLVRDDAADNARFWVASRKPTLP